MSEFSALAGQGDSAKSAQSPAQRGVTQLIEYVRVLIELSDKPVWSLASYGNVVLHEEYLRDRVGIRHDLPDIDGSIYVKIDRLRRTDPPPPPVAAKEWLTIGRDPFKEPVIQALRTTVMPATEAERLIAQGVVDREDVAKTLSPGQERSCGMSCCASTGFPRRKNRSKIISPRPGLNGQKPNGRDARRSISMIASSAFSRR